MQYISVSHAFVRSRRSTSCTKPIRSEGIYTYVLLLPLPPGQSWGEWLSGLTTRLRSVLTHTAAAAAAPALRLGRSSFLGHGMRANKNGVVHCGTPSGGHTLLTGVRFKALSIFWHFFCCLRGAICSSSLTGLDFFSTLIEVIPKLRYNGLPPTPRDRRQSMLVICR